MRLVYISNSRLPSEYAHGLQVMQMCEAFAEQGIETELLVPRRFNRLTEDPFLFYGINKTFSITKVPCLDLIFWNNKNIFFWIQTVSFLIFAKVYLAFKKYDILYTREQSVGLFFKNFVFEIHSLPKKVKIFHKKIWNAAQGLIVLTPFIKDDICRTGLPENKVLVSPDGVKVEKFNIPLSTAEAKEKAGLPQDKKIVGYMGAFRTLGMEKGLNFAIKAMKLISHEDVLLLLVGGHKADIEFYNSLANQLGVGNKVICIGRIKHTDVPVYLKAFDVAIAPFPADLHYYHYMSPMKIFEYMAAGKPIVATNLPSLTQIFNNKEGALLVEPESDSALALGIEKVLNDKDLEERMGKENLARSREFTWNSRAVKILDFIKNEKNN